MSDEILITVEHGLLKLVFNRPSRKDEVKDEMCLRLDNALERAEADPALWAVPSRAPARPSRPAMTWAD